MRLVPVYALCIYTPATIYCGDPEHNSVARKITFTWQASIKETEHVSYHSISIISYLV